MNDPAFDAADQRLTIDLAALVANWRLLAARSAPAKTAAVVKADAYGLGIGPVAAALIGAGCDTFFVASVPEGAALRAIAQQARIFVLNGVHDGTVALCREATLAPVLASDTQIRLWAGSGALPYALQVDTGMNRLGLSPAQAGALASAGFRPLDAAPLLLMSHLACADTLSHRLNERQLESFRAVSALFEGVDSSLSNSAATLGDTRFHFDLTRPGIALYGGEAITGMANPMAPVVTAEARVLQVREVRKDASVSYGAHHIARRDSRIATVAIGYADGYHRSHSGAGVPLRQTDAPAPHAFAAGFKIPLVGRITMDLTMFDITDIPEGLIEAGDYVELFGPNHPLDAVARAAGTIGYEILTSLGRRYKRRYIDV